MSTAVTDERADDVLQGVRMTAEEFLALPEGSRRYELIDGVIFMSPSPMPVHQRIGREVLMQLDRFLEANPLGEVLYDLDVHLGQGSSGRDIVYRPDVLFIRSDDKPGSWEPLQSVPALVVEVVSPATRHLDNRTKRDDYERLGVEEYWLIDPERKSIHVQHLQKGRYIRVECASDSHPSRAVPGFVMDLKRIRRHFQES